MRIRTVLISTAAALALTAAACAPPPSPPVAAPPEPPPTLPAPTLPPVPTTTPPTLPPTPTTTPAPSGPSCVSTAPAGSAEASTAVAPLDSGEAADAAVAAAQDAEQTGTEVVISTVDDAGRPSYQTVDPDTAEAATAAADRTGDVVAVTAVQPVTLTAAADPYRPTQWAFNSVAFESAWGCGRGSGVKIAVVDTGIDSTHPEFAGKVAASVAFQDGTAVAQPGAGGVDPHGHGTHVAGIAAAANNTVGITGVAPDATLLAARALGADGNGWDNDVAAGITWAVDNDADVINLSIGGDYSSPIDTAIAYAVAHDVLVIAAAGNTGDGGAAQYPGSDPDVVAVASFTSAGNISTFSTRGAYVDVAAPGSMIRSSLPGGAWGYMSGTSMAAPHVAGLAAIIRSAAPGLTAEQVRNRIINTANDGGTAGFDTSYGWGVIDPVEAVAP